MSTIKHEFADGKYTVIFNEQTGELHGLRNGEPWQDFSGNKLIYCMLSEVNRLREALRVAQESIVDLMRDERFNELEEERDALQAKLSTIEAQEPVATKLEMAASLMEEAASIFEEIDVSILESLPNWRWPITDELGGAALILRDQIAAPVAPAQPVNELVEAAQNAIGCFNAAGVEGLDIALTETTDERLKDLIERRLMHAPGPLADALANAKAAQPITKEQVEKVLGALEKSYRCDLNQRKEAIEIMKGVRG